MKRLLAGILLSGSISSFAQSIDWNLVASQATALTDIKLCFERVLDKKAIPSSCNDEISKAGEVGITREQASTALYEIAKYRVIAKNARIATDKDLNKKIKKLVSVEDIENLLKNL